MADAKESWINPRTLGALAGAGTFGTLGYLAGGGKKRNKLLMGLLGAAGGGFAGYKAGDVYGKQQAALAEDAKRFADAAKTLTDLKGQRSALEEQNKKLTEQVARAPEFEQQRQTGETLQKNINPEQVAGMADGLIKQGLELVAKGQAAEGRKLLDQARGLVKGVVAIKMSGKGSFDQGKLEGNTSLVYNDMLNKHQSPQK